MNAARRLSQLRRRYRNQLSDAAVILAALTFVVMAGTIGIWILHTSLAR